MLSAWIVALFAYNLEKIDKIRYYVNGSNNFDISIAYFCAVITTLVSIEYRKDNLLFIISSTIALSTINNLLDEVFFNPFEYNFNELCFGLIIALNLVNQLNKIIRNGNATQ